MVSANDCVALVRESTERVRLLLASVGDGKQTIDSDLVFKEIKSDLKDSTAAYISAGSGNELATSLLAAVDKCVQTITVEFFHTFSDDAQTLLLHKCVNMYLGFTSVAFDKSRTPELYVTALCIRIQALEAIGLLLLKRSHYAELEDYTKQLAEEITSFKNVGGKTEKEKLQARHAESVLQLLRFAAVTATAPHSEAALECLYAAKNTCGDDFPAMQKYISSRAYDTGVVCFKGRHYRHSASYFRESFCLGKKSTAVDHQAHTLYLLGCAYLRWDEKAHWEKAVNALDVAIWQRPGRLQYLAKKLEALLCAGVSGGKEISSTLDCVLKHKEVTVKRVLGVHQSLRERGHAQQATEFLQKAYTRFSQDADALHLLVALLRVELDSGELDRASVTFQRILVQDGGAGNRCLGLLFRFLFHFGCRSAESERSVQWLRNCEALAATFQLGTPEVDSLRLCLAHWAAGLGMAQRAREALGLYRGTDHLTTGYLQLRIALEEDSRDDALAAAHSLMNLVKEANPLEREAVLKKVSGALIYVGSLALQAGKASITKGVLRAMASPPEKRPAVAAVQLTCLRCIAALCLTNYDEEPDVYEEVVDCIKKAQAILTVCDNEPLAQEHCPWFAHVCWNLALQPEMGAGQQFGLLGHAFALSLHGAAPAARSGSYALGALLSGVAAARQAADAHVRDALLRDVRGVAEKFRACNPSWRENSQQAALVLAAEFEAAVHTGSGEAVLDEILSWPAANTDFLEGFVAVAQGIGGQKGAQLCVPLLQRCVLLAGAQTPPNKSLKFYHLLFQALLDSRDEAGLLASVEQVVRISQSFPEAELVWMMCGVWNEGLGRYLEGARVSAQRLLGCAARLATVLPVLRGVYQQTLGTRYRRLFPDEEPLFAGVLLN
ncbi:testis-expressed protein 11-like [Haemaphysalis longicornis]